MNKQNVYSGISLINKKEWNSDTYYNMDEPWKYYTKVKEAKHRRARIV